MPTILVVDDEHDIRTMVRFMLEGVGWEVEEAPDGEYAIQLVTDNDYDVVVLDQRMPGLSGFEVACRIRELGYRGGIVFFSAYLDDELRHRITSQVDQKLATVGKTDPKAFLAAVAELA